MVFLVFIYLLSWLLRNDIQCNAAVFGHCKYSNIENTHDNGNLMPLFLFLCLQGSGTLFSEESVKCPSLLT